MAYQVKMLVARRRIRGTLPHYEYRVFVPFDEISAERQALLTNRSDYGFKPGPWARISEVIAPMDYLRLQPGGIRYEMGRAIDAVAKRIEATTVRHVYPEMDAPTLPIVFTAPGEFPDALAWTEAFELTGQFNHLSRSGQPLTAEALGLASPAAARAA